MLRDGVRVRPAVRPALFGACLLSIVLLVLPLGRLAELEREEDDPDAAEAYENAKRAPRDVALEPARLYAAALDRVARLPRFSSRIARELSSQQPRARLWAAGSSARTLEDGNSASALLDAWTPLGPGNIGGRTRVVRYHPLNPNVIFAAGVSGGIWKTDDNAITWRPMADGLANIAVNALVIDPNEPDVMFVGTGEGYFREEIRNTGLPLRGSGIFITRDGGRAWQQLRATASRDFHWVNDVELGLGDSRIVYAATRTGVWRSIDRGATWLSLLNVTVRGGCLDLALRRDGSHDVLFAACGSYEQASIYRFPAAEIDARVELVLREPGQGRTSLAIAPANPDVIYALAASNDPGPQGNYRQALLAVYRSVHGGAAGTWETRVSNQDSTRLNTLLLTNVSGATVRDCGSQAPNSFTNMGWYTNVIAVDPRDPNRVWAAGVDWFRSDDGGVTWGLVSAQAASSSTQAAVHVDQHGFAFHPGYDGESNQTLIVANDGGLFRTTTARGRTTTGTRAGCSPVNIELQWQSLNRGYGVTQFYHGLPFPDGERYFAGAQDNGTVLGSDEAGPDGWRGIFGGDGGYVALDPGNTNVLYAETQWAALVKSTNGGLSFTAATRGLDAVQSDVLGPEANYLFVAPYVMDPSNAQRLWLGGEYLYRTTNAATQWVKASALVPDGGLVSTIAIAAQDTNRVVAGTHRGHVLSTRRALESTSTTIWSASRPREGWVTSVTLDPDNPDIVFATYGNFGGSHVFRSEDGGVTWQTLDGSGDRALPDIPVHSLVVDPADRSRLYLGTDLGVFVSADGGAGWMVEETGFGPVVTEWLSLIRDPSGRRRLFAFTHGRGVWRVDLR